MLPKSKKFPFLQCILNKVREGNICFSRIFPHFLLFGTAFLALVIIFHQIYNAGRNERIVSNRSLMMLNEIRSLHGQLQQIADNVKNSSDIRDAISSLDHELARIEKSVSDNAKSTDIKRINSQLMIIQANLEDFENSITTQFNTKKYMDAKTLPFQVNHLDMISGQPFVSVDYDHHVTPLGIGDSLNGWALTAADYSGQTVEFENVKGQYVKVTLEN